MKRVYRIGLFLHHGVYLSPILCYYMSFCAPRRSKSWRRHCRVRRGRSWLLGIVATEGWLGNSPGHSLNGRHAVALARTGTCLPPAVRPAAGTEVIGGHRPRRMRGCGTGGTSVQTQRQRRRRRTGTGAGQQATETGAKVVVHPAVYDWIHESIDWSIDRSIELMFYSPLAVLLSSGPGLEAPRT